jgi:CubicO group peptidase (beta-lactamase class C family)
MSNERSLSLATFIFLVAVAAIPLRAQDARLDAIDRYVAQARMDWQAPAIAVSIVKDDRVVFARGYGVLDVGGDAAADKHTLFAIGSSTKAFTTASLSMLIDEGLLDWDDRVTEHLPWLQMKDPWVTHELRVRDLVTHRIGTK